jgi:ribosome-associated heat shock protein Hsp15
LLHISIATGLETPGIEGGLALHQRLDKWLWFARVTRTRSLAARLVTSGHVRINARRVQTPAKPVGPGDVLTIALEERVRVLRVVAAGERRQGFPQASQLFEELTPARPSNASMLLPERVDPASRL